MSESEFSKAGCRLWVTDTEGNQKSSECFYTELSDGLYSISFPLAEAVSAWAFDSGHEPLMVIADALALLGDRSSIAEAVEAGENGNESDRALSRMLRAAQEYREAEAARRGA